MNGLRLAQIVAVSVGICLLATLTAAGPATAGRETAAGDHRPTAAVTLNATVGYGTFIRQADWAPVYVTLSASEPVDGEVAVSTVPDRSRLYGVPVTMASKTEKRVTLYAPPTTNPIEVLFLSDGKVIAATTPPALNMGDADRLAVVVSDPPDGWNFLADLATPFGGQTRVAQMLPTAIPEESAALDAVDLVIFDNVDTLSLSSAQREAIHAWVLGGGHLVLGGGPGARLTIGGFSDFAPARVGATVQSSSVGVLRELLSPNSTTADVTHVISQAAILRSITSNAPDVTAPVIALQPSAGDVRTLVSSKDTPLVMRRDLGRGTVDQLAFDPALAPVRDWLDRSLVFAGLLGQQVGNTSQVGPLKAEGGAASAARALPGAALPPFLVVAGFLLLYVVAIGPVNFFFLRKLNRLAWAWVTVPGTVLLFAALGYATGFRLRGNEPEVHRLSVIAGEAGLPDGRSQVIVGLFSPRRTTLDVSTGNNLALEVQPNPNVQSNLSFQFNSPNLLEKVVATNSDVRSFYLEGESSLPDVQADVRLVPGRTLSETTRLVGQISNQSNASLTDCVLVVGKDYHAIGNIGPHQQVAASADLLLGRPQMGFAMLGNPLAPSGAGSGFGYGTSSLGSSYGRGSPSSVPVSSFRSPFDMDGASLSDALLNWRNFRNDSLKEQAERGLVMAVFDIPDATLGNGAYLACWEDQDRTGVSIPGANYTDRGLRIWHLPVRPFLLGSGVALPADVFEWGVLATSSTVAVDETGMDLDVGDHIIGLTPWLSMRTSGPVSVTLTVGASMNSSISALHASSVWLYDWQALQFTQVITGLDDTSTSAAVTGAYLSPSGELRARVEARDDQITLTDIQAQVQAP